MRTRFALILYFRMVAHKAACHTLSIFFKISEDMVQILLMLEILFIQDFKGEYLFCGAPSGSESACYSAMISSAWGLSLFKMIFSMTLND